MLIAKFTCRIHPVDDDLEAETIDKLAHPVAVPLIADLWEADKLLRVVTGHCGNLCRQWQADSVVAAGMIGQIDLPLCRGRCCGQWSG